MYNCIHRGHRHDRARRRHPGARDGQERRLPAAAAAAAATTTTTIIIIIICMITSV